MILMVKNVHLVVYVIVQSAFGINPIGSNDPNGTTNHIFNSKNLNYIST